MMTEMARKASDYLTVVGNRSGKILLSSLLCVVMLGAASGCAAFEIITYGTNALTWNARLMVNAIRMGCSSPPEVCVASAKRRAQEQAVSKIYLAVPLEVTTPRDVERYRRTLEQSDLVAEIGFDDFVGKYRRLAERHSARRAAATLKRVIDTSPAKVGVTLYEDQLASQWLEDPRLPEQIRAGVGNVHLYLHYRTDAVNLRRYVAQVRNLFPEAAIIGGVYAYDRRDYVGCEKGGRRPCTEEEELELFRVSLENELALVSESALVGIEFYPAKFGQEEIWKGWENPRVCRPAHRESCIRQTRKMRQIVLEALSGQGLRQRAPATP